MYLKLYYPNRWIETHLISDQTTVRDVIFNVLGKKQIPLSFYRAFSIIHTYQSESQNKKSKIKGLKEDLVGYTYILKHDTLIEPLLKMNNISSPMFLFYILVQPYYTDLQRLEFTFLQMLYQQCQADILNNKYPIDDPKKYYQLGGITASYDFGQYDQEKYKPGFLKKNINNILPLQSTQHSKLQDVEKEIFDNWRTLSFEIQTNKNELSLAYLQTAKNIIPQYGSFVIKGTYNKKHDAFYYINQVGIQIRSEQDGKCFFDGKIGSFEQIFQDLRTTTISSLKIGAKKVEHVFQAVEQLDIESLQKYIQSEQPYQRDYMDEFIEQFIKSQQLNTAQQISPDASQIQLLEQEKNKALDIDAFTIEQNVLEKHDDQLAEVPNLVNDDKCQDVNSELIKSPPMVFQPNALLVPPKIQTPDEDTKEV